MITMVGIAPHPAIIIPEIGKEDLPTVRNTVEGMKKLSELFKKHEPSLLVVITPHGSVFKEGPAVLLDEHLQGDFGQFGHPEIKMTFETDTELAKLLEEETAAGPLHPIFISQDDYFSPGMKKLDHGAMVPLYYLNEAGVAGKGLHITFGFNSFHNLYSFGKALKRAIDRRGLKTAILASGDLSHRLIPGAPAGYNPRGREYDQLLVDLIRERQVEEILTIDRNLVEDAGECGLRSFIIGLGTLDGTYFKTEIISYEGPFGVGYLVASLVPEVQEVKESFGKGESGQKSKHLSAEGENPAHFARRILDKYYEGFDPDQLTVRPPSTMSNKAGTFVSLKKEGRLRGCMGTAVPKKNNIAEEIASNAIVAATRDPRFPAVEKSELDDLEISVDVLGPMEEVDDESDLDPKVYGVMVRSGYRSGLLLPDLEGVSSVRDQLAIAMQKAGISPGENVEIFRFTVNRYNERD